MRLGRRNFVQLLSASALSAAFPASILKALEIPAHRRTGTIADVEHIVILMQENRSFDHYFGALRGVRGFGDPRAVQLASGNPVWRQPDGDAPVLPFHPGAPNLGLQFVEDLKHDWTSTQAAWRAGHYDGWVAQKGGTTMAHLVRSDIPFHFALADAFTVCDAYHCSLLGPTDPNRFHMWTGWVGNDGLGGGPVVDNAEAGYAWSTYPERLERAGIRWKVYQDLGAGLSRHTDWGDGKNAYIGNYGDNSLLYFRQYQEAGPGHPLHEKARTGTRAAAGGSLFSHFRQDVRAGLLPQVAWIVAPEAYCEHPNWPANYGAWYVAQILDALTANPAVWSKTVLFLTYDENDGFFDHMVPPTPPMSVEQGRSTLDASNEIFPGDARYPRGPYGLGVRVPMLVISPWSTGGWVASEVFDHTSLLRFIERRFGPDHPELQETNITAWRRAVCGDLTSTLDFASSSPAVVSLPSTIAYRPPDNQRHPDYKPAPPAEPRMPVQEVGMRPARAVPYELHVAGSADAAAGMFHLRFENTGRAAAVFQVRSGSNGDAPRTYTVEPQAELTDGWAISPDDAVYKLCVYGPNGFFRGFEGRLSGPGDAVPEGVLTYDVPRSCVVLQFLHQGEGARTMRVLDAYAQETTVAELQPGAPWQKSWPVEKNHGWYELVIACDADPAFRQRLAGHLESGKASMSDPAMARG